MNESIGALTHSPPMSVDKALNECFIACNLTDVHLAFRGLDTLLARPKSENEDDADADIHDGVLALIRFTRESMRRRGGHALTALQALALAIQRERMKRSA
jgi:hypothetical protein